MSLPIWARGGLVLLTGSAISGTIVGFTKLSPSTYSGSGVAERPRLVIARGNGSGAELSFNYDSFFGGGQERTGKPIPFKEVEMKFGDYKLQEGDLLCSPEQQGEYFVLRPTGRMHLYRRVPTYSVEGYPEEVIGCNSRFFSDQEKFRKIKRVKLTGFRHKGTEINSAGVNTIRVSNCSFSLEKTGGDSIGSIMASGCTTGSGVRIDTFPISSQYEVS